MGTAITSVYSTASVEQYASKQGISIADAWLLLCNKYADMGYWVESDRCYTEYLNAEMPKPKQNEYDTYFADAIAQGRREDSIMHERQENALNNAYESVGESIEF